MNLNMPFSREMRNDFVSRTARSSDIASSTPSLSTSAPLSSDEKGRRELDALLGEEVLHGSILQGFQSTGKSSTGQRATAFTSSTPHRVVASSSGETKSSHDRTCAAPSPRDSSASSATPSVLTPSSATTIKASSCLSSEYHPLTDPMSRNSLPSVLPHEVLDSSLLLDKGCPDPSISAAHVELVAVCNTP